MAIADQQREPVIQYLREIGLRADEAEEIWRVVRPGRCQDTFTFGITEDLRVEIHLAVGGVRVRATLDECQEPLYEKYLWLPYLAPAARQRSKELAEAYDRLPVLRGEKRARRRGRRRGTMAGAAA